MTSPCWRWVVRGPDRGGRRGELNVNNVSVTCWSTADNTQHVNQSQYSSSDPNTTQFRMAVSIDFDVCTVAGVRVVLYVRALLCAIEHADSATVLQHSSALCSCSSLQELQRQGEG